MSIKYKVRDYFKIKGNHQLSPLLERLYSARGISKVEQVDYSLKQLLNPNDIYQLSDCARFLASHIVKQSKFLIVGDYDADGATSTALMIKGLTQLGVQQIDFVLPDRLTEGYGLSSSLVNRILQQQADVVITVDTGIASLDGVDTLKTAGIDVIVTDHHLAADTLPNADYIINPNAYSKAVAPLGRCLAGVGIAFYVLLALRAELRQRSYFTQTQIEPNLALLLDFVALGTVADLVPLDHLNRILVAQGLSLMQQNKCSDGVRALFQVSNKVLSQASHQHLGFNIAPRLNAAGRLEDMSLGVQCLLASSQQAISLANQLDSINNQRRSLQSDMKIDSESLLDGLLNNGEYPLGIVLSHKDWHEGVVGIVASQIKEKTYRPVFIFAHAESGELKGSGRSIAGIHLRDVLDQIDKQNSALINKFGGHAMAAGLTIDETKLEAFNQVFQQVLKQSINPQLFLQQRITDGELLPSELNLETAEELDKAGPWG
ncbi:MAG: single-stranded-DNA-specific exonuclease RecJ, partial [Gammaproteobacteria bacterium]|nr:single-stranded-DNA-specific exonuclease RecJ [Gammaproteobacteria bacterium]